MTFICFQNCHWSTLIDWHRCNKIYNIKLLNSYPAIHSPFTLTRIQKSRWDKILIFFVFINNKNILTLSHSWSWELRFIISWFLNNVIIIKTKVLLHKAYVILSCQGPLVYLLTPKDFKIIWLSNHLTNAGYTRNVSCALRCQTTNSPIRA